MDNNDEVIEIWIDLYFGFDWDERDELIMFVCACVCVMNLVIVSIQLTPNTVLEISSNEGRECGLDCKHAETSWMYGCGQSGFSEGRTLPPTICL